MTVARGVALAALGLVVILVAWLLLRGDGGHEYQLVFLNAGQLVRDDNVEVGGRRIGSVRKIELTDDNLARVTVEVEEPYAPLHVGTKATIRLTSLSGIANRYVALALGPDSNAGAPGRPGPRHRLDDQRRRPRPALQHARPADARSLQGVIQGFATQYADKGPEANQAAEYFNPALSTSRRLVEQLTEDEASLTRFIVNTADAVTAIAERRNDLSGLVANANATAGAIAAENVALAQRARPAADHAAQREHHVREPALDARRPRHARRRVQARHQGPGAVPARPAPARARRAARRSATSAR